VYGSIPQRFFGLAHAGPFFLREAMRAESVARFFRAGFEKISAAP
jgi:hypothetical protein